MQVHARDSGRGDARRIVQVQVEPMVVWKGNSDFGQRPPFLAAEPHEQHADLGIRCPGSGPAAARDRQVGLPGMLGDLGKRLTVGYGRSEPVRSLRPDFRLHFARAGVARPLPYV